MAGPPKHKLNLMSDATGGTVPGTVTGTLALADGGLWTAGSIQVSTGDGGGDLSGLLVVAASSSGAPTTLDAGSIILGNTQLLSRGFVYIGGSLDVTGGSVINATQLTVDGTGSEILVDSASSLIVGSGPAQAGALVVSSAATFEAGGCDISANVDLNGDIVSAGPMISGSLTGGGSLISGPLTEYPFPVSTDIVIGDASGFTGSITLEGVPVLDISAGSLVLQQGDAPSASLVLNDGQVDLQGVPFTGQAPSYDPLSGVLTVDAATLNVGAGFTAGDFTTTVDGIGGTLITETGVPCYASGTRVATERGEVMVQHLRVGDQVRLAAGGTAPIVWLGHRHVDCRRHPRPSNVCPVRVQAGAFGRGLPHRDLFLSPDHAVFFEDVLIPVRHLINGATIVQQAVASVSYWHVELARHDVILAEGLPCESFLDTGNGGAFENGGAAVHLHPDFSQRLWDGHACAPLVVAGPELEEVRAALAEHIALQLPSRRRTAAR
jgi:hypothetical protein